MVDVCVGNGCWCLVLAMVAVVGAVLLAAGMQTSAVVDVSKQ
jgi:hypothetical protein